VSSLAGRRTVRLSWCGVESVVGRWLCPCCAGLHSGLALYLLWCAGCCGVGDSAGGSLQALQVASLQVHLYLGVGEGQGGTLGSLRCAQVQHVCIVSLSPP
jgi:hypothetical protein